MYEEASDKIGGRLVPFQALETVQMQSKEPQEAWKDKQGALVGRQEADGDRRGAEFVFFTTFVSLAPLQGVWVHQLESDPKGLFTR